MDSFELNKILGAILGTCILVLVIASIVFTALGGWLCSNREFHVKTPETE